MPGGEKILFSGVEQGGVAPFRQAQKPGVLALLLGEVGGRGINVSDTGRWLAADLSLDHGGEVGLARIAHQLADARLRGSK